METLDDVSGELKECALWAKENNLPLSEAKNRFAQYAVLCGISNTGVFSEGVVFKGEMHWILFGSLIAAQRISIFP
jgi:hypothetical protein